jgi:hypothetical protein
VWDCIFDGGEDRSDAAAFGFEAVTKLGRHGQCHAVELPAVSQLAQAPWQFLRRPPECEGS